MEVSGKIQNSPELSFSCQIMALSQFWNRQEEFRNLWNIPDYMVLVYIWHVISWLFPDFSEAFLKSIYKGKFSKGHLWSNFTV